MDGSISVLPSVELKILVFVHPCPEGIFQGNPQVVAALIRYCDVFDGEKLILFDQVYHTFFQQFLT